MSFEQPHTASIVTAQTRSNPDDVKVEEIPLPPVEMWAALENSAPPLRLRQRMSGREPGRDFGRPN